MAKESISIREVKSEFETILNDNAKAVSQLQEALKSIETDKSNVQEIYTRALDRFVGDILHPLDKAALKTLSSLTTDKRDFEAQYNQARQDSSTADMRLNGLVATHGSVAQMNKTVVALNAVTETLTRETKVARDHILFYEKNLAPVDDFNKQAAAAGKAELKEGGIDYFSSKKGFAHVWAFVFDSHYRQGRSLIKSLDDANTIVSLQASLQTEQGVLAEKKARHAQAEEKQVAAEAVLQDMEKTESRVVSDPDIRQQIKADILQQFESASYFGAVAAKMKDSFPQIVLENRAKLEHLGTLSAGGKKTLGVVSDANNKLDKHLPKLRKAISRGGGYKKMSIDMSSIKAGFKPLQVGVRKQAVQLKQRSATVRKTSYAPRIAAAPQQGSAAASGSFTPLDAMMAFIIYDSLTDVGMADLGGSFNDAVDGLDAAGSVDVAGLDAVDMASVDVSVPDISVPDISVPDISIDVGGGGFDFGGGGGDFGGF